MILALSTAGDETVLQLYRPAAGGPERVSSETWHSGRQLSEGLPTRITALLAAAGAGLDDMTGIVVMSGPGSFTSLRIGHTVANALADGLGIPVVGAMGTAWVRDGLVALDGARPGQPAWPVYGSEPRITKPRG